MTPITLPILLIFFILFLGLRTFLWHVQSWQLREYRWDRMRAWLHTKDGKKSIWNLWFFKGFLPRPKFSGRVILITFIWLFLAVLFYLLILAYPLSELYHECSKLKDDFDCDARKYVSDEAFLIMTLIWERTIWLQVAIAVWISSIPVNLRKKLLFRKARKIVESADENLVKIAITGSYGKSSTKELLVHLMTQKFGTENVLYNPANNNTEVAIARLIIKNKSFFQNTPSASPPNLGEENKRILIIETGAYRKGEIATVSKIIKPDYGILTGLNQQHVELFGSVENIRNAKFELAEGTQKVVFFNADNPSLVEIFEDKKIKATKIPISFQAAKNIQESPNKTTFEVYGQKCVLPWPGKFFVHNALLALECAREIGLDPKNFPSYLKTLPPLERALSSEVRPQGFTVLRDTYSSNPDGVLQAIEHLKNFSGKRIFVSIPLRELGGHAETVHTQIFEKLKSINAEVYWEKNDFSDLGKQILGNKFHQDFGWLEKQVNHLGKNDVVLLESKLSAKVLKLF